ncbi:helix-turn-helix domain-containing protein [Natronosalvus halobius]|uniref:helix-turn-helix domain-containing protein n=1 Tax=Natronosalvus halobius TaxID=2953746 RepID=UPI00209F300F|nr:helix-turn-helix domain-containing protein [Natronosalvus halobius]USZ71260.1 hypothetical protein NGM15_14425 [Natronosalvus halobius]
MTDEAEDFTFQESIYKVLASEVRLRLLKKAAEGEPISAPDLAKSGEFNITAESIVNNLNRLENIGLLESKTVRGPGNRPRKEFSVPKDGKSLKFELVPDDYHFMFEDAGTADF